MLILRKIHECLAGIYFLKQQSDLSPLANLANVAMLKRYKLRINAVVEGIIKAMFIMQQFNSQH